MTTPEHDEMRTGRSVTGPAEPTQAEIRAGKEAALRIEGGAEDPDYWVNRLMPDEAPGRSRLLGDDGPLDGDDEAERALRMMELTNERADIDLERDKLAHARLVASDGLRLEALHTAREIVRGYKFGTPTDHTRELAAQYRRLLGLLEEPDPANPTQAG